MKMKMQKCVKQFLPFFHRTMLLVSFGIPALLACAQNMSGITGKPDTGYTIYSAYTGTLKDHPGIKIVPELKKATIRETRDISYCNIGSRELRLDVFQPAQKAGDLRTAVIFIHGGGWRTGNRAQHYALAQRLADLGYVCFTPEYRLSTEALFPAGIYDIKAAIRWVRKHATTYGLDTTRIVAAGFSAGGEMAAFIGTTGNMPLFEGTLCNTEYQSRVNAVIDIDGTLSFVHPDGREGDDSKRISAATHWFGYPKKGNEFLWQVASPLSYVSRLTPPTIFLNSAVPWMHAGREDYIKVLQEHNIYSEVHEFEKAPHSFPLFDPWFQPMLNYIDAFLKKVFDKK